MKKVIWPILLFSFMIILAGCNVTNQEKENQNDENAVDSLDAVPTMEEWMELTQDAEEEEKAALYEQLQALLDEATEEEVQQAVENSVKDWAEKQEWLDVEAVFVELAADPLMMDEQTGERLYANRTAQVEIQYSRERGMPPAWSSNPCFWIKWPRRRAAPLMGCLPCTPSNSPAAAALTA